MSTFKVQKSFKEVMFSKTWLLVITNVVLLIACVLYFSGLFKAHRFSEGDGGFSFFKVLKSKEESASEDEANVQAQQDDSALPADAMAGSPVSPAVPMNAMSVGSETTTTEDNRFVEEASDTEAAAIEATQIKAQITALEMSTPVFVEELRKAPQKRISEGVYLVQADFIPSLNIETLDETASGTRPFIGLEKDDQRSGLQLTLLKPTAASASTNSDTTTATATASTVPAASAATESYSYSLEWLMPNRRKETAASLTDVKPGQKYLVILHSWPAMDEITKEATKSQSLFKVLESNDYQQKKSEFTILVEFDKP